MQQTISADSQSKDSEEEVDNGERTGSHPSSTNNSSAGVLQCTDENRRLTLGSNENCVNSSDSSIDKEYPQGTNESQGHTVTKNKAGQSRNANHSLRPNPPKTQKLNLEEKVNDDFDGNGVEEGEGSDESGSYSDSDESADESDSSGINSADSKESFVPYNSDYSSGSAEEGEGATQLDRGHTGVRGRQQGVDIRGDASVEEERTNKLGCLESKLKK